MADEKVYNIPLREAFDKNRIDRANYAVKLVEKYLKTHTKKENIRLGRHLNNLIWSKGAKKPPRMVRVKAVIDKDVVKAELLGKEYEEFVAMKMKKKEKLIDQLKARMGAKAEQKQKEEEMIEGKKPESEKKEEVSEKESIKTNNADEKESKN